VRKVILLIAMPDSVHVARWLKQIDSTQWEVHLFPSTAGTEIHPELGGVTLHSPLFSWLTKKVNATTEPRAHSMVSFGLDFFFRKTFRNYVHGYKVRRLCKTVRMIRPDLIHSLEIQAAGYLTSDAKRQFQGQFPPWLITNWGSDLFLFGRLQQHKARIVDALKQCDYYSCECDRDLELAQKYGFTGQLMPVFPNSGGFDLPSIKLDRFRIRPSARKLIMLKGYQNWAGRALFGLRALNRCSDLLTGYTVAIYSAPPDVVIAAELFSSESGISVQIVPINTPHQEMLSLHAKARISIGLSISDGISTSFLEALAMGSFPIQSCTACVGEWIENGVSGLIVPPEDPDKIETAIRTALSDDDLVDYAAQLNWHTVTQRLDDALLKQKVALMYSKILQGNDDL
jgi:hypothetical protein